jgi:DNA-binding transcriptional ArsR family regulator
MAENNELTDDVLKMAAFAKAMSHPVRVYILKKLAKMDVCCYSGDIAEELQIGRSGLSQHIKELKHAGLINGHEKKPFIQYCIHKENWEIARKLFHDMFDN